MAGITIGKAGAPRTSRHAALNRGRRARSALVGDAPTDATLARHCLSCPLESTPSSRPGSTIQNASAPLPCLVDIQVEHKAKSEVGDQRPPLRSCVGKSP